MIKAYLNKWCKNETLSVLCPQVHVLEEENISLAEQCSRLHANLETTDKDKHATEKKCAQVCMFNQQKLVKT